jgi:lipopolysaccharide transport system permease protein
VLVVALTIVGGFVLPWIPLMLVAMVILAVFAAGLALMLSVANVHFRDTQYFVTIVLQLWLYLTPIIYPITLVETQSEAVGGIFGSSITILDIYNLNPMVYFVELFRNLLYDNRFPDPSTWLWCLVAAGVSIVIGVLVFRRGERGLAEAL